MDNNKKHIINRLTSKQEGKSGFTTPKNYFDDVENDFFAKLSENAVECLKNNKALPLCSAEDSFIDMEIINKIVLSAKNKSIVKKINLKAS